VQFKDIRNYKISCTKFNILINQMYINTVLRVDSCLDWDG